VGIGYRAKLAGGKKREAITRSVTASRGGVLLGKLNKRKAIIAYKYSQNTTGTKNSHSS
jgi:hypothetical protein